MRMKQPLKLISAVMSKTKDNIDENNTECNVNKERKIEVFSKYFYTTSPVNSLLFPYGENSLVNYHQKIIEPQFSKCCFGCLQTFPQKFSYGNFKQPDVTNSLDGIVVHPMWSTDLICKNCAVQCSRCIICERPSSGRQDLIVSKVNAGETLFLCDICCDSGIVESLNDLTYIIKEAIDYLWLDPIFKINFLNIFTVTTDPLHLRNVKTTQSSKNRHKPFLYIHLESIHSLSQPMCSNKCNPGCLGQLAFGKFFRFGCNKELPNPSRNQKCINNDNAIFDIAIGYRLQIDTAVGVLAHEFMHAYLSLHDAVVDKNLEETLCNAVSVRAFQFRQHLLQDMLRRQHHSLTLSCCAQRKMQPVLLLRKEICDFRCKRILMDTASRENHISIILKLVEQNFINWKTFIVKEKPQSSVD